MKRAALWIFSLALLVSRVTAAQVRVQVSERDTGRRLENAEVINRSTNETLLTNESGEAVLPDRWTDATPLRIRQVGFHFIDTTLARPAGEARVLRIILRRIAYVLPPVPVNAAGCGDAQDPSSALVAATALDQLRMAAERYDVFRRRQPFRAHLERRTKYFDLEGNPRNEVVNPEITSSDHWEERYVPGRLIDRSWRGFSVQLLFLLNLADPEFWRWHCFRVTGMESLGERRVLRLAFNPVQRVKHPDWAGWVLLDSATSELRRVEFRLVHLSSGDRPRKLEGFTTFMSPTPNIVVPESTAAVWWRDRLPADASSRPDVLQLILLKSLEFKNQDKP